jgi:hypothetical protein
MIREKNHKPNRVSKGAAREPSNTREIEKW